MRSLLLFIIFLYTAKTQAQESKTVLLIDYIKTLETTNSINFSYDNQLLQDVKILPLDNQNITETLSYLKKETAFNFKSLNNGTVLVSPYSTDKNIKFCLNLKDAEFNTSLIGATISNENKDETILFNEDTVVEYVSYKNWKTFHINYLGYKEKIISIDEFNGKPCQTIYLSPSEIILDDVLINYLTSGIKYSKDSQGIEINVKDAGLLPGETETDLFTSIEALPGINSSNGKAGNLVLRGDDPDKTLVYYDNIPIYHNGHYFGTFSPYNADLLKTVTIKRNGYDAKNGGGIAGLIKMNTNDKVADSASYSLGLATSYFLANANIPIIKDKWSVQIGSRSSYPVDINTPKINAIEDFIFQQSIISQVSKDSALELNTFDFNFSDYNLKSNFKINDKNSLNFSSLFVTNDLDIVVERSNPTGPGNGGPGNGGPGNGGPGNGGPGNGGPGNGGPGNGGPGNGGPGNGGPPPLEESTKDNTFVHLENIGFSLKHQVNWKANLTTESFITYSKFNQNFYNELAPPGNIIASSSYKNVINNFSLKTTTSKTFDNKNFLDIGAEIKDYEVIGERTRQNPNNTSNEKDVANGKLYSLYSNFLIKSLTPLTIKLGLRTTYFSLKKENVYIEPRILINYKINNRLSLKGSAGIYNQFLNHVSGRNGIGAGVEQFNWKLSNNSNIPVVNGKQVMFGAIYKIKGWLIDLEGYHKKTDNISVYDLYNYDNTSYLFTGNYNTFGADLLIRKSWNNIDTWVSYSNIKTLAQFDDIQTDSFRSVWDQNHQLNIVCSYTYKKLKISTGWKYKSGLESLENIRQFYINGPSPNQPNLPNFTYSNREDRQYSEYPGQHQLDLSLAYTFQPNNKYWNAVFGIAATNVYDQKNIFGQDRYASGPSQYSLSNRYMVGFAPSALVKFNF